MSIIDNIMTGNKAIDGLIHAKKWGSKNITYSFPKSMDDYGLFYPPESISYFREASEPIKRKVRKFFEEIESIIDVKFIECEANPGRAVIRIAQSFVRKPHAYMPDSHNCAGDIWFPTTEEYRASSDGSFEHHAIHHEIGHALGLKHPHQHGAFGRLPQEYDSSRFTVMSYDAERDNQSLGCSRDQYPQSFMPLDVLALQALYGQAARSPNSGTHNLYSWDPVTGHGFRDGQHRNKASGNYVFETIVDDGGWDTFDFSNFKRDLNIDLRPGGGEPCHAMPPALRRGP
ncbi:hypothetical protein CHELA1G11_14648 [Hyphomicrobiales bacterium]|nr:hypothetical protein CHELA1G2_14459 [Hyphomicrobiales bacterium]CAH1680056.1 hypothetical protein CHELA1G11_14648 [Hyphomicrobiales bacterium]